MSTSKSLDDKQLIRAIADMVARNPQYAKELFNSLDDIIDLYPELYVIKSVVENYKQANYFDKLLGEIEKISDRDAKNIFKIAIDSAKNENFLSHNKKMITG